MGNTQISAFSRGNEADSKVDGNSRLPLTSNIIKSIIINLKGIDKTLQLDLVSSSISFKEFRKEFESQINLPADTSAKYYTINSMTSEMEIMEDDYLISNITKEITMEIHKNNAYSKPIELTLTIMKKESIEVMTLQTFNFIPLKYTLGFLNKEEKPFRLFKGDDPLLSDPLDLDKSLLGYKLTEKEVNLILYEPNEADMVKIVILNNTRGIINIFEMDKFMRISQLTESYNKEANGFYVLCHPDTGLKFYENFTIENIAKDQKSVSVIAQEFEEYYSKNMQLVRQNPLEKEEIQTNFLELPD